MDTQNICEFVELAKRLNVTETAKALHMSQPTLSKHIASLEKSIHVNLFSRSSQGLQLTREGVELLAESYEIMEAQKRFDQKVKSLSSRPLPKLSIGGLTGEKLVIELLAHLISVLGETYGQNFLAIKPSHHMSPIEMLRNNAVDICFDYISEADIQNEEDIDSVLVGRIPWIALVDKKNPIAEKEELHFDDLKNQTLIKIEGSHLSSAWQRIEASCLAHGFEPRYRRHYSMKVVDLVTTSANLGAEVLLIGENFAHRVFSGSNLFAKSIPIVDADAYLPVSAVFRMSNNNPLLDEALNEMAEVTRTIADD